MLKNKKFQNNFNILDLMGVFARFINREKFSDQLIEDCLKFVQNVLINESDPEVKIFR